MDNFHHILRKLTHRGHWRFNLQEHFCCGKSQLLEHLGHRVFCENLDKSFLYGFFFFITFLFSLNKYLRRSNLGREGFMPVQTQPFVMERSWRQGYEPHCFSNKEQTPSFKWTVYVSPVVKTSFSFYSKIAKLWAIKIVHIQN